MKDDAIRPDVAVGDLVVRHPQLRPCLEKLKIDYCCGGKVPLGDAVAEIGLEWTYVANELADALAAKQPAEAGIDWSTAPLRLLVDHILDTHHAFMKEQLPRLDGLLAKVRAAHGDRHAEMLDRLRLAYSSLRIELEMHLMKEEQILFPAIKGIDAFLSGEAGRPAIHCGSIANPIRQMEQEHTDAGGELAKMRWLTEGFQLPADACPTFVALYDGLQAMEADLHEHIHLENNILFPRGIQRETEMANR